MKNNANEKYSPGIVQLSSHISHIVMLHNPLLIFTAATRKMNVSTVISYMETIWLDGPGQYTKPKTAFHVSFK